jgi:hypothetical protein
MKRFHVHIAVEKLDDSIRFYSSLFGVAPTVQKFRHVALTLRRRIEVFLTLPLATLDRVDYTGQTQRDRAEVIMSLSPRRSNVLLRSSDRFGGSPDSELCTGGALAPSAYIASSTLGCADAAGRLMRRLYMDVDAKAAGKYVLDLEVVCTVLDPEDMANRIAYLPLD